MSEPEASPGDTPTARPNETLPQSDEAGAADKPAAGKLIAERYEIVRPLGEGGMASVFLARDTDSGDEVALKIPHFTGESESLLKRLRREGRAIAAISHPNVCGFRDIAEHRDRLFLTMDYIPGGTLSEWMQTHPDVTEDQAVSIVIKIARAMDAAHSAGVVHRDLKAGNIMMTEQGEPVVTDFGMVSWTDSQETVLTPTGAMVGTPGYMSPEQITCDKEKIGPATDVYGMGVILYELLTGWMPFSGNLATLLGSVVSDPPPPPTKHTADLDPRLEKIVLKALEKAPEDRFAGATEFADALQRYRSIDPEESLVGGDPGGEQEPVRRTGARAWLMGKLRRSGRQSDR